MLESVKGTIGGKGKTGLNIFCGQFQEILNDFSLGYPLRQILR
jgi:hypothetical protein